MTTLLLRIAATKLEIGVIGFFLHVGDMIMDWIDHVLDCTNFVPYVSGL